MKELHSYKGWTLYVEIDEDYDGDNRKNTFFVVNDKGENRPFGFSPYEFPTPASFQFLVDAGFPARCMHRHWTNDLIDRMKSQTVAAE